MANSGIPTKIDDRHAIAHNKIMVIDGETVVTGSFNFTKAAEESNAENLLVIKDRAMAARYGPDAESGIGFVVGYAHAKGLPVVGFRTDCRTSEEKGLSVMLDRGCTAVIHQPMFDNYGFLLRPILILS